jgi:uncharacterized membrane protein YfcA
MTMGAGVLLFFSGLCAGFIDSIAGGGGLVSVPVLLSVGMPPQIALGTNKLQSSFGSFSASCYYIRKGQADLKEAGKGIFFTLAGAVMGSWLLQQLDPGFIRHIIPFMLLVVFLYTLFSGKMGYETHDAIMPRTLFYTVIGLCLGFYDGFFGPGTGSFWTAAFVILLGFNMTKAAGFTRIMNFTSNIVALLIFIIGSKVIYSAGLCMASGQIIGAFAGSRLAVRNGAKFIRPVFMTVILATILRLIYVNYA